MRIVSLLRRPDVVDGTAEAVMRIARRAISSMATGERATADDVRLPDNLQYPPSRRTRRLVRTAQAGGG